MKYRLIKRTDPIKEPEEAPVLENIPIVGIDTGRTGAIGAYIFKEHKPEIISIDELCTHSSREISAMHLLHDYAKKYEHFCIEEIGTLKKNPKVTLSLGYSMGITIGSLKRYKGITIYPVHPRTWQTVIPKEYLGKSKEKARSMITDFLSSKDIIKMKVLENDIHEKKGEIHTGKMDSILIAYYLYVLSKSK